MWNISKELVYLSHKTILNSVVVLHDPVQWIFQNISKSILILFKNLYMRTVIYRCSWVNLWNTK